MVTRTFPKPGLSIGSMALLVAILLGACSQSQSSQGTSAASLMPTISGYQVNDTLNVQDAIAKITGVAAIGTGQPAIAAAVTAINALATCYQQAGAVKGRSYVQIADPLKAVVILIVDRNAVTDPKTILSCVAPKAASALAATQYQPCAKAYTLNTSDNQFYIAYAATRS